MRHRYLTALAMCALLWASSTAAADLADARRRTRAKAELLKRTAGLLERLEHQGPDEVAETLTKEDLEALLYSKEPALGQGVLNYCTLRFGEDLQRHADDPECFRNAMAYLAKIRYEPCAAPLARAVGKMDWGPDHAAIVPICSVLQSIVFVRRFRGEGDHPRKRILSQLLSDYTNNLYYLGGPAKALQAMGDEDTVIALIGIMERTQDRGLKQRKSQVLTVIKSMLRPSYPRALARLGETIREAPGQNAYYAMALAEPFASRDIDNALVAAATNKGAPVWTRGDAIRTIGRRKLARYRELIESIGRDEEGLHQAVAQALKDIGGQGSLPLLASYLEGPENVSIYAAEAIGSIADQPFHADAKGVESALEWWKARSVKPEQPDATRRR